MQDKLVRILLHTTVTLTSANSLLSGFFASKHRFFLNFNALLANLAKPVL